MAKCAHKNSLRMFRKVSSTSDNFGGLSRQGSSSSSPIAQESRYLFEESHVEERAEEGLKSCNFLVVLHYTLNSAVQRAVRFGRMSKVDATLEWEVGFGSSAMLGTLSLQPPPTSCLAL